MLQGGIGLRTARIVDEDHPSYGDPSRYVESQNSLIVLCGTFIHFIYDLIVSDILGIWLINYRSVFL